MTDQGYGGRAGGNGGAPPPNPYAQGGSYGQGAPNPYGGSAPNGQGAPNPYAQGGPYGQGAPNPYGQPYPAPAPAPANPYAQPLPPQPIPSQAAPVAQPAPAQQPAPAHRPTPAPQHPAPVGAGGPIGHYPGPAPRRNPVAVLLQFTLQWIYAPLWIAALVALFALLLWSGGGGPSAPNSDAWLKVNRTFIPPRRLKAELTGKPEDWERYVTPILERRIRDAEQKHAFGAGDVAEDFSRVMHVKLAVRLYRGLGAAGVVRIAERYGWHGGASDEGRVRVRRVFPAPAPVAVPGPLDPPAAPGTPWGPQPSRPAVLLPFMLVLQIAYVPLCGVLGLLLFWGRHARPDYWDRWGARWAVGPRAFWAELTGSSAAWDRHIRRILKPDRGAPRKKADEPGVPSPVIRAVVPARTRVNLATYRGAGAQEVLRIAAEQGWVLDPAYTPEPEACVRLYKPHRAA
ncbi:hypothetical protein RMN57_19365 [Kitasatospora sp. CM 4170]|uniref:Uncharacterized protein n=1 Tax=Kitasatospora aburaviensis TaxID=67265 RepID=A0ABW1EZ13_9ACTN|nr:hypothetical protein [Kitasatospora sp. CM 4170]WNM46707.1 hypothetical protein RMN57_19365 [Kitasatospora sp. CM 4170]